MFQQQLQDKPRQEDLRKGLLSCGLRILKLLAQEESYHTCKCTQRASLQEVR